MYKEFMIIYAGLGILAVLMLVIIALQIRILKDKPVSNIYSAPVTNIAAQPSGGVVFCKKCATQFDASLKVCPKCGTPR